jgi:hypothetical protein
MERREERGKQERGEVLEAREDPSVPTTTGPGPPRNTAMLTGSHTGEEFTQGRETETGTGTALRSQTLGRTWHQRGQSQTAIHRSEVCCSY